MFTTDTHHYFVEPVPDYLHNAYGEIYEKPHIIYRRSLEEVNSFHGVNHLLSSVFGKSSEKPCATESKFSSSKRFLEEN
jgi:hypothetical protein